MLVGAVMGRGPFYYVTIGAVVHRARPLGQHQLRRLSPRPLPCSSPRIASSPTRSPCAGGASCVHPGHPRAVRPLGGALLVAFGGITDRLIPLFRDRGAFLAFTMSQAGMVAHWRRIGGKEARHSLPINAVGAVRHRGDAWSVVAVSKCSPRGHGSPSS